MARPTKQGIDYFPLDVDADQDDKLAMIIAEFGCKGELIFIKLLAWIYKNNGYFVHWDEMEQLKFAKRVSYIGDVRVNLINEVVARCVKWGIFNKAVFDKSHVLTSARIQSTWLDATKRRTDRQMDPEIWLPEVNADERDTKTGLKYGNNPQRKLKEKKEKETKEEETKTEENNTSCQGKASLGEFVAYFIDNGYSMVVAERAWQNYELAGWCDEHGKPIRNWKLKAASTWFKPEYKAQPRGKRPMVW